ncbi:MAG: rhodanese-like domain-containing protein [Dehalococcoidia bacterium]
MVDNGYAAPELLADTDWLAQRLGNANIRIVEISTTLEAFEQGHIPGAVLCEDWHIKSVDNPALAATPPEAQALFESLGIGDETLVVAYDRMRSRDASRLWWVLTYYSHTNVKVLDGGWKKWTLEGRPVEAGKGARARPQQPVTFTPNPDPSVLSTLDTLKAAIAAPEKVIWDIRSEAEYTGENDRGNKRSGHVPGARHLEWTELVTEHDHTFKPAGEIRKLASGLGITSDTIVHVY